MHKRILFLLSVACLLTACEEAIPVKYAQVCDLANDGKLVETMGFLDDGGGIMCSNTRDRNTVECGFKFSEQLSDKSKANKEKNKEVKTISADIARGDGANKVAKLESGYKHSDIKIKDNDGKVISLDKQVKLTVRVRTSAAPSPKLSAVCYLTVKKIEQP